MVAAAAAAAKAKEVAGVGNEMLLVNALTHPRHTSDDQEETVGQFAQIPCGSPVLRDASPGYGGFRNQESRPRPGARHRGQRR